MNFDYPHRRLNLLTNDWVLVSPHRARRPWLGQVEEVAPENLPEYDPDCYLCPGNSRAGGHRNPPYTSTFVFDNDFSALLPEIPQDEKASTSASHTSSLYVSSKATGITRVVCFSPRHNLSMPEFTLSEIEAIIRTWSEQTAELGSRPDVSYVQVFENKGAMMGASNPHPHSQIWASSYIPDEPARELHSQGTYLSENESCLLCDYVREETSNQQRVVLENEHFISLVPYWAIWPFETMLVSKRHMTSLPGLRQEEVSSLADIIQRLTTKYDNLFNISFPYSMGFHQAPTDGKEYPGVHFHAHYYPPLLRSANVRKYMVGYEMLAMPQRDLTPETAAERLRGLSERHYRL
jgi:UDPglucose--hexose-1-phosphate uridylyltransferase